MRGGEGSSAHPPQAHPRPPAHARTHTGAAPAEGGGRSAWIADDMVGRALDIAIDVTRAERIPVILPIFADACRQQRRRKLILMVRGTWRELEQCHRHCGDVFNATIAHIGHVHAPASKCTCVANLAAHDRQHTTLYKLATGEADLLFVHMDMYVNMRLLESLPWFANGTASATPASGIPWDMNRDVNFTSHKTVCIDAAMVPHCVPVNVTCGYGAGHSCCMMDCGGVIWQWWSNSLHYCHVGAKEGGFRQCCFGWSDFVFVPRQKHTLLRRILTHLWGAMHDVSIPTALNALKQVHGLPWKNVDCFGSCCTAVPFNATTRRGLCAHKISLQSHHLSNYSCLDGPVPSPPLGFDRPHDITRPPSFGVASRIPPFDSASRMVAMTPWIPFTRGSVTTRNVTTPVCDTPPLYVVRVSPSSTSTAAPLSNITATDSVHDHVHYHDVEE